MILDPIRRKYVKLTPEEWVRQNFIQIPCYMRGNILPGLLGLRCFSALNKLKRRTDILVHNRWGKPVMIVECKSPDIILDDNLEVFDQIVRYNHGIRGPLYCCYKRNDHYACKIRYTGKKYEFLIIFPFMMIY